MAALTQANRPLAVTTPLGPDVLLLEKISGSEAISELYSFRLDMLSTKSDPLAFGDLLGQKITVEIRTNDGRNKRYFNGIINRLSQGSKATGQEKETFIKYQAEIVPQLWLLGRNRNSRIFQTVSVPDILKEILQKQWSLDVVFQLQGNFLPRDYCVQYEESDLNFVSRLMEEEGIFYFFVHKEDGHQMVVANTPTSHPDLAGVDSVPFEEEGGGAPDPNRVTNWIKTQEIRTPKVTLWDYCFELPASHLDSQESVLGKKVAVGTVQHPLQIGGNQKLELYDWPGGYAQRFDGVQPGGGDRSADIQNIFTDNKRTCHIRMEQETIQGLAIEGAGRCWQFTGGSKFNFKGHFDADGTYVLARIAHTANMEGAYTSGAADTPMTYRNTFTCIPLALPYRPQRKTPKPQIVGPQTAVVVGPPGQEIFYDKYGRVKVQFLWDRLGKMDPGSSCWVRVAQFWAGKAWGAFFWPRKGNEVVVSFEEGDPDRPIIIGSVYNGANMPPFAMPTNGWIEGIKSCTIRKTPDQFFNGIIFDDQPGQEHLAIHSERTLSLNAELDKEVHAGRNHDQVVPSNHFHTVGGMPGGGGGGGPDFGGGEGGGTGIGNQGQSSNQSVQDMGAVSSGSNPWTWNPQNTAPTGTNSVAVFGQNIQGIMGINFQTVFGNNIQLCMNPLALLAGLAPPGFAVLAGAGLGGNLQLCMGTNRAINIGPSYQINVGPDQKTLSAKDHTATKVIAGILAGVEALFLTLYGSLSSFDGRQTTVITFHVLTDLTLVALMEAETIYDQGCTDIEEVFTKLFHCHRAGMWLWEHLPQALGGR